MTDTVMMVEYPLITSFELPLGTPNKELDNLIKRIGKLGHGELLGFGCLFPQKLRQTYIYFKSESDAEFTAEMLFSNLPMDTVIIW